jgi:hypothetical protein
MKQHAKAIVGVAATAFFLWLALHDVPWSEVWTHLREADPGLFLAAVLVSTLGMHVRAMRWRPLLAPLRPDVPFRPRIAGTATGFALNNLLPARVGEFARVLVCAREGRIKVAGVFGTLVVERVLDAVVILSLLFGVIALQGLPGDAEAVAAARNGARFAAALAVVMGAGLLVLAAFPAFTLRLAGTVSERVLPARFRRPAMELVHAFLGGLAALRSPWLLAQAVAWAVFQWLFLGTSFLLGFWAFGIREPGYGGALLLQSLVSIAAALPAAPGFWGPFEAASKYGLALYGVDEARAVAFAIAFHMAGWLTVTGLGLYYVARLNLRWSELRGSARRVEGAVEAEPGHG